MVLMLAVSISLLWKPQMIKRGYMAVIRLLLFQPELNYSAKHIVAEMLAVLYIEAHQQGYLLHLRRAHLLSVLIKSIGANIFGLRE